jgi:hypothetical protein
VASVTGLREKQIWRHLYKNGLKLRNKYSVCPDEVLGDFVGKILKEKGRIGIKV